MIKNNRKKKAPPALTDEQVAEDAHNSLVKAIDSGKFCVFIGYEENGKFTFSEHRTPLHLGDLYKMQNLIDGVISKAAIPSRQAQRKKGKRP